MLGLDGVEGLLVIWTKDEESCGSDIWLKGCVRLPSERNLCTHDVSSGVTIHYANNPIVGLLA